MLNTQGPQEVPFFRAPRRGEDLCAYSLGELHSGQAHASRGCVDQDAFAGTKPTHVVQRIGGRQESDGKSCCLCEIEIGWLRNDKVSGNHDKGSETAGCYCDDLISYVEITHAFSKGDYLPRTLGTESYRSLR